MDLKDRYDVIIIGGGISGCILANRIKNKKILIVDANTCLMNKIYATGNGRCNLTNSDFNINKYNSSNPEILGKFLTEYDNKSFIEWLKSVCILTRDVDGYVYPMNFEAKSVVENISKDVVDNRNIDILTETEIKNIGKDFVYIDKRKVNGKYIVLACGGLASNLNKITKNPLDLIDIPTEITLPALVSLKASKKYLKRLEGVRVNVEGELYVDGISVQKEMGQVHFKSDGLSGIISFQFSSKTAKAIKTGKNVKCKLNYIYDKDIDTVRSILMKDIENISNIVPKKLAQILEYLAVRKNDHIDIKVEKLLNILQNHSIEILDVGKFKEAQIMHGGYRLTEFTNNLESKSYPNTFVIGEMLDVDGLCGGYNIQWAYTSASIVARKINDEI